MNVASELEGDETPLRGRVLVVDDNQLNLYVAEQQLLDMGLEVDVANDGVEAVERCREQRYDAVIMDCDMPRMTGPEATRMIREQACSAETQVPIVALTAYATVHDQRICFDAGMNAFLTKPVMFDALHRCLSRWLTASA